LINIHIVKIVKHLDTSRPDSPDIALLAPLQVEVPNDLEDLLKKTFVTNRDVVALLEKHKVDKKHINRLLPHLRQAKIPTGALGSGE
jgi:hypothetical protein